MSGIGMVLFLSSPLQSMHVFTHLRSNICNLNFSHSLRHDGGSMTHTGKRTLSIYVEEMTAILWVHLYANNEGGSIK